ncbi:MAG TPA: CvpA family protein [Candidatus Dormibacteraeota bacterium]|nr:CvpA family protein [Candidatus Dormibacteraeota bacterium]
MTWIDLMPVVLIAVYGVGGYFTGVLRRLIGVVALYLACWAATNMGLQAGGILQQSSNLETSDARIYGFFGIIVAVLLLVEVATQLAHSQIQIPALVLNHTLGAIAGLITGVLLAVILIYELGAAANPIGGPQLDQLEQHLRDSVNGSAFAVTIVNKVSPPIIGLFQPVLPSDPQIYFGPGPVNP